MTKPILCVSCGRASRCPIPKTALECDNYLFDAYHATPEEFVAAAGSINTKINEFLKQYRVKYGKNPSLDEVAEFCKRSGQHG